MTEQHQERLYELLPAIYRTRDAERGEPLRALLAVIQQEVDRLEADMDGLYDNWFVETAEEWLLPYLADLLGVRMPHTVESAGVFSLRAYVANTLQYRQRKGTAAVLEQLADDITGWEARCRGVLSASGHYTASKSSAAGQRAHPEFARHERTRTA